jgi:hypothetical protein
MKDLIVCMRDEVGATARELLLIIVDVDSLSPASLEMKSFKMCIRRDSVPSVARGDECELTENPQIPDRPYQKISIRKSAFGELVSRKTRSC